MGEFSEVNQTCGFKSNANITLNLSFLQNVSIEYTFFYLRITISIAYRSYRSYFFELSTYYSAFSIFTPILGLIVNIIATNKIQAFAKFKTLGGVFMLPIFALAIEGG